MGTLPPGPGTKNAWRHVGEFTANRAEFLLRMHRQYGDVVYFKIGPAGIYLLNDPDLVKDVLQKHDEFPKTNSLEFLKTVLGEGLITSGGDYHRRQRRMMTPAFSAKRVATYESTILDFTRQMSDSWRDGAEVDLTTEMGKLTLSIICKTMFHAEMEGMLDRVQEALNEILPVIDKMAKPGPRIFMVMRSTFSPRFRKARKKLYGIIDEIIERSRASGEDHGDLLSVMLRARDEEGDGKGMTDLQIRDETLTVFLSGHETTALALSWTWYLLAQHPDVMAKLQDELETLLGGRLPTMEDVPNFKYMEMVINESLRLYPPSYLSDRTLVKDWDIGECVIPAKSYIFVSPYTMGRHEKYYPEPDTFDPERWTAEEKEKRPKWAYIPWGGGPRTCIGGTFAWAELMLVMATLAQEWTMTLSPGQKFETAPLITLRAKDGIKVRLESRKRAAVIAGS